MFHMFWPIDPQEMSKWKNQQPQTDVNHVGRGLPQQPGTIVSLVFRGKQQNFEYLFPKNSNPEYWFNHGRASEVAEILTQGKDFFYDQLLCELTLIPKIGFYWYGKISCHVDRYAMFDNVHVIQDFIACNGKNFFVCQIYVQSSIYQSQIHILKNKTRNL